LELEHILPVIRELGVAGALLVMLVWLTKRYDTLQEVSSAQIVRVNEKRVEEARVASRDLERQLEVIAQMTQNMATCALAFKEASQVLQHLTERLERLIERSERRETRREDQS